MASSSSNKFWFESGWIAQSVSRASACFWAIGRIIATWQPGLASESGNRANTRESGNRAFVNNLAIGLLLTIWQSGTTLKLEEQR